MPFHKTELSILETILLPESYIDACINFPLELDFKSIPITQGSAKNFTFSSEFDNRIS